MPDKVTVSDLKRFKQEGRKIAGVVAWDTHMARIADLAGADLISVGDTVGKNLWGHDNPLEIGMDEMVVVTKAVRRGTSRALVSVDYPFGPLQEGTAAAVAAAIRFVKEAGVDMVKLDGAAEYPEAVAAVTRAGIPVFAQIGLTPQTAMIYGMDYAAQAGADAIVSDEMTDMLVAQAREMEEAGAVMIDFTNSGPVAGEAVAKAVSIPVIGGFGGGPWLDGRVRMAHAAIGYGANWLEPKGESYANVAQIADTAFRELFDDIRAGRQIKGGPKPRKG